MFKYLQSKYGEENVARVGAFNRFTCKSALRKIMSTYGFSQSEIAKVIALLPKTLKFSLEEAMEGSKELTKWLNDRPNILRVVRKFEGLFSHFSTHAGGVLICEGITSMLPIITDSEDRSKYIVALDKMELERLGHYKFDILGLNSLILMKDITDFTGPVDWSKVDFEDQHIYDMLCEGDVAGVFQLSEQRDKVVQQKPRCFNDLIAINALIRPGVCDWDEYLKRRATHNEEEHLPYMEATHGLIVYQDQYLQLAQTYAGWDIAFSDKHIRKNKNILNDVELKEKWYADCEANGSNPLDYIPLWEEICGIVSGGYGFNKAHSTSYAMLSYQTAYMKYYHPKEFYAAYLSQNIDKDEVLIPTINHLKKQGTKLLPPDLNKSTDKFLPVEEGILCPLSIIKGVGANVYKAIQKLTPITSLQDLLDRRVKKDIKNNSVEGLIKAGCFDFEEKNTFILLERINSSAKALPKYEYEKEVFGFYLSESPFEKYSIKPFDSFNDGGYVSTIVEIASLSIRYDRNGNEMAFATGINNMDTIRLVFFSSLWKKMQCEDGQIVLIKGKKDGTNLLVNELEVV